MSDEAAQKLEISAVPNPIKVSLDQPKTAARPGYGKQITYMRDISKWIVGGVIATAAAVATGASLTNIGALNFSETPIRLALSLLGFAIGAFAIGRIFTFALHIFTTDVATLDDIIDAGKTGMSPNPKFVNLAKEVETTFAFAKNGDSWDDLVIEPTTGVCKKPELDRRICEMLGFLNIRLEFIALQESLLRWGPVAMAGFVLFAWSANPAEAEAEPAPSMQEVVEFEYGDDGKVIRRTTRSIPFKEPSVE